MQFCCRPTSTGWNWSHGAVLHCSGLWIQVCLIRFDFLWKGRQCKWPLSSDLSPASSSTSPRSCARWSVMISCPPPPKSSWSRRNSCCWPSSPSCRSSCTTIPSCRSAPCTPCRCTATPARSLKVHNPHDNLLELYRCTAAVNLNKRNKSLKKKKVLGSFETVSLLHSLATREHWQQKVGTSLSVLSFLKTQIISIVFDSCSVTDPAALAALWILCTIKQMMLYLMLVVEQNCLFLSGNINAVL